LGARNIFQDVVAILPGEDFTDAVDRALTNSDAALVVIGPRWLTVTGPDGVRRLEQPLDNVRAEVEAALGRDLRVIPVLVGGATMPNGTDLPAGLEPLVHRQGVALRDTTWQQDVDGLVGALKGEPAGGRRRSHVIAAAVPLVLIAAIAVIVGARALGNSKTPAGGSKFPTCPTPASEWTSLPLTASAPTEVAGNSGAWSIDPTAAHQIAESGRWRLVLTVRASNVGSGSHYQDRSFYELAVAGVEFPPTCFGVVEGNDLLAGNSTNVSLVGFELPADPSIGRLALDLNVDGGRARVELR
jgi:hypothetical protein